MAVYLMGLVLLTAAIELTLALLLASQGKVPSPSSVFWLLYLVVDIGLFVGGGVLVPRGVGKLRAQSSPPSGAPEVQGPPSN